VRPDQIAAETAWVMAFSTKHLPAPGREVVRAAHRPPAQKLVLDLVKLVSDGGGVGGGQAGPPGGDLLADLLDPRGHGVLERRPVIKRRLVIGTTPVGIPQASCGSPVTRSSARRYLGWGRLVDAPECSARAWTSLKTSAHHRPQHVRLYQTNGMMSPRSDDSKGKARQDHHAMAADKWRRAGVRCRRRTIARSGAASAITSIMARRVSGSMSASLRSPVPVTAQAWRSRRPAIAGSDGCQIHASFPDFFW
jgi:hypothetical protein